MSAAQAYGDGLAGRVVARAELPSAGLELVQELATKAAVALAAAKYAMLDAMDPRIDEGLAFEPDLWARLFDTPGRKEGVRAFLEKRALPERSREDWDAVSAGFPWAPRPGKVAGGKRNKVEASGRC